MPDETLYQDGAAEAYHSATDLTEQKLDAPKQPWHLARWVAVYEDIMERCIKGNEKPSKSELSTLLQYGKQFSEADSPLDNTEHAILEAKMYRAGCASGFVTCLARAFEAADEKHLVRLHSVFPEFGAALYKLKTQPHSLDDV